MERTGWRAIIYDAPWARFKDGQAGVFVSDDGKSCETLDDDRSNIIVEAEENQIPTQSRTGHILFRQKGSDLFDIVCLFQDAVGTYQLSVDPVTVNGCKGKSYNDFKNELIVYEKINDGPEKKVDDFELILPTESDFAQNLKDKAGQTLTIKVSKNGKTAESYVTVSPEDADVEVYSNTTIEGFDEENILFCKMEEGDSSSCEIKFHTIKTPIGDNDGIPIFGCSGGTIEVSMNKTKSTDPVYKIVINNVTITDYYDVYQCEELKKTITKQGEATYSIVNQDGITIKSSGGNSITLSIKEGINEITLILTTNKGKTREITLTVPSQLCTNLEQN